MEPSKFSKRNKHIHLADYLTLSLRNIHRLSEGGFQNNLILKRACRIKVN